MTGESLIDQELQNLGRLLGLLLGAAHLWSQQKEFDEGVAEAIRHRAILVNHRRYVRLVPAYRGLAEAQGLEGVDDVGTIVDELMVTGEFFKSYDRRWLDSGDFERMTGWLGTIFVRRPQIDLRGVGRIQEWRERLKADGISLTCSSGTSGRISFVPRDGFTLSALQTSGRFYPHSVWGALGGQERFDCLVLGRRGFGLGIQAGAAGLSRMAARSHFLLDAEVGAGAVRAAGMGESASGPGGDLEGAYARSHDFLEDAVRAGRPVLVFGTPPWIDRACSWALARRGEVRLPAGSIVVSGGGWKSSAPLGREELLARVEASWGVEASRVIDTYSTSELNCVLMSCAEGRYHIPPLVEPVVLDDLLGGVYGNDVEGLIGFLDPFAASYPGFVITGDRARLVRGRCGCGLRGWALAGEIRRAAESGPKGCAGAMTPVMA